MAADARAMGIAGARLSRVQGLLRLKGTEPADPQDPGSEARHTREFQRAVAQLLQDGPSIQDVARAVDVPAAVVKQWRDASGQKTGKGTRRNRPNYSPEVKEQALRDVEAGKPIPEVAGELGIHSTTLSGWVNAAED